MLKLDQQIKLDSIIKNNKEIFIKLSPIKQDSKIFILITEFEVNKLLETATKQNVGSNPTNRQSTWALLKSLGFDPRSYERPNLSEGKLYGRSGRAYWDNGFWLAFNPREATL